MRQYRIRHRQHRRREKVDQKRQKESNAIGESDGLCTRRIYQQIHIEDRKKARKGPLNEKGDRTYTNVREPTMRMVHVASNGESENLGTVYQVEVYPRMNNDYRYIHHIDQYWNQRE